MALDTVSAQNQMTEIARMAYGSGTFEGTSGGKGNIGLLTGADGQARVIKFNTHFSERGKATTAEQIKSSNALRAQLLSIAETLKPEVLGELRKKLGIAEGGEAASCKNLLTRQVVASALKMIDGNAMSDAMKGVNAASLKSLGGTNFEEARVHTNYGVSSATLQKCGMSAADFEESLSALAAKFNLSDANKQIVGRMTAGCLRALAEEGRTGQLDESGKPKQGLPSKEELKKQISEGTFTGTYMGLVRVDKLSARSPAFRSAEKLLGNGALAVLNGLSHDACVDAAYLLGKLATGPRDSMVGNNQVGGFAFRALMEKRETLMAMHQKDGNLSVDTIWKEVTGKGIPKGGKNSACDFTNAVHQNFFDKLVNVDKNPVAIEKWGCGENADCEQFVAAGSGVILLSVQNFGVTLDQATKLVLDGEAKELDICKGASAYETSSSVFKESTEASLLSQIQSDITRARGDSSFKVSDGKTTRSIVHKKEESKEASEVQAKDLLKALNKLIGGGDEITEPLPPQLKTMGLLSTQAGNNFLALSGMGAAELDHHPTEKSFTLQDDGTVLFSASGVVDGTLHTISYQINTDGTSSLLDYKRVDADPAVLAQLPGKTDGEKFKNYEKLSALILKTGPDLPADELKARMCAAIPKMFFRFDQSKIETAKEGLRNLLTQTVVDTRAGKIRDSRFNSLTGVNMQTLREMNGKPVSINGQAVPKADADIPAVIVKIDGIPDGKLADDGVWTDGATGIDKRSVWVHKQLCTAIPDRRMREFVSTMMSMSLGVQGFFSGSVETNGVDGDTLKLFGDEQVGHFPLLGMGIMAAPIEGKTIPDAYDITTNDQGDVRIEARFTVGTQVLGGFGPSGEDGVLGRNDFKIVMNLKNEFDENGIPKMAFESFEVE